MRCTNELIHTEEFEGFTVRFYAQPEEDDPSGCFASGDDEADAETLHRIENGTYLWFMVECVASKEGVDLGHDYLGGCCYESCAEFLGRPGFGLEGYAFDMRLEAVEQAKATLAKLCAP